MAFTQTVINQNIQTDLLAFRDSVTGAHALAVIGMDTSGETGGTLSAISQPAAVSVGNSTTVVLAENTDRKYLLLINDSDETMYVHLGQAATMNRGIRLNANGGSYEMSAGMGNLYTGAVNAICTSGGKNLLVTEGE